mmetsp:Transcript_14414/g.31177  ORF Transcript_14414/g.31177 Transcript_14414/m.31177 type:complete len:193 (-) Transcript_14414:700-1278(-)|eukprot:CAMPEP_0202891142 /NCGR_PEP_ID=MMETSP1392-20130828/1292_1 /ASSEMBLY_ACC=CAM_ASM_000868 /TAXON_ID=225041 /ORGANISM="Chlamydomonas chlamydogama, Strain SAG 11-48b" /LENGTH=192 /DNA_ID=CAMNT_0049574821 /DNA_START=67 /DNA_END=645 /DNA_ORIENTATION=+
MMSLSYPSSVQLHRKPSAQACHFRAASVVLRANLARRGVRQIVASADLGSSDANPQPPASTVPEQKEVAEDTTPETVFFEGHGGSNVELAISLALAATLIYAPLTLQSVGRRAWLKYKFTNKRVIITNTSPLFKGEVQIKYSQLKEVRTAPRAFGAWGDMVLFTKRGERLELIGLEKYAELKEYIERCMYTL